MAITLRLLVAGDEFVEKHRKPQVIRLEENTEVLNMSDTSNRKPDGDFEDSWTQYWMAFSNEKTLKCSVCETLLWNKENNKSIEVCKDLIRQHEINKHVEGKNVDESLSEYESQGGHVQLEGVIYITPLCIQHNKEEIGENIVLKAGAVLVEEVDPIILQE